MKRFQFGRYIHKDSLIHVMNPLVKLCMLMALITLSAAMKSVLSFAVMGAALIVLLFCSKISIKEFYPSIRAFRFLFIFTFLIQAFFRADGTLSFPNEETLLFSLAACLKFIFIIAFSAFFTITTTPADIVRSLYFFIKPFKVFKVDTRSAAVSLLVAVRFIPLLFDEAQKIVTAQKLRNVWADKKGLKAKFSFFMKAESFIIPLFMRVINYAEQISVTLLYRENLESVMRLDRVKAREYLVIAMLVFLCVVVYAVR